MHHRSRRSRKEKGHRQIPFSRTSLFKQKGLHKENRCRDLTKANPLERVALARRKRTRSYHNHAPLDKLCVALLGGPLRNTAPDNLAPHPTAPGGRGLCTISVPRPKAGGCTAHTSREMGGKEVPRRFAAIRGFTAITPHQRYTRDPSVAPFP